MFEINRVITKYLNEIIIVYVTWEGLGPWHKKGVLTGLVLTSVAVTTLLCKIKLLIYQTDLSCLVTFIDFFHCTNVCLNIEHNVM